MRGVETKIADCNRRAARLPCLRRGVRPGRQGCGAGSDAGRGEQRSLERQLRHAQKLEAVGQFAAGVAHDFNNMLTVIQGYTSMSLGRRRAGCRVAECLGQVAQAADRAGALTSKAAYFQPQTDRPATGARSQRHAARLHGMLRRVIGEHIELSCEFTESLPAIFADESNIEQVVMNLVANARDAMLNGGRLDIRTEVLAVNAAHIRRHAQARLGDFVCLTVRDTGVRMSPDTLNHIFECIVQHDQGGRQRGAGIGLATVYGIVSQLDGWIGVASRMNEGTMFRILLPVCEGEAERDTAEDNVDNIHGNGERILLVEDERAVREIITAILQDHGYEVSGAEDGPSFAIQLWEGRGGAFDVLVTDIP